MPAFNIGGPRACRTDSDSEHRRLKSHVDLDLPVKDAMHIYHSQDTDSSNCARISLLVEYLFMALQFLRTTFGCHKIFCYYMNQTYPHRSKLQIYLDYVLTSSNDNKCICSTTALGLRNGLISLHVTKINLKEEIRKEGDKYLWGSRIYRRTYTLHIVWIEYLNTKYLPLELNIYFKLILHNDIIQELQFNLILFCSA
jgi:hypothetical protein